MLGVWVCYCHLLRVYAGYLNRALNGSSGCGALTHAVPRDRTSVHHSLWPVSVTTYRPCPSLLMASLRHLLWSVSVTLYGRSPSHLMAGLSHPLWSVSVTLITCLRHLLWSVSPSLRRARLRYFVWPSTFISANLLACFERYRLER